MENSRAPIMEVYSLENHLNSGSHCLGHLRIPNHTEHIRPPHALVKLQSVAPLGGSLLGAISIQHIRAGFQHVPLRLINEELALRNAKNSFMDHLRNEKVMNSRGQGILSGSSSAESKSNCKNRVLYTLQLSCEKKVENG